MMEGNYIYQDQQTKEVTHYQYQFKEKSVFFYQEEKVGEAPKNILILKQEDISNLFGTTKHYQKS